VENLTFFDIFAFRHFLTFDIFNFDFFRIDIFTFDHIFFDVFHFGIFGFDVLMKRAGILCVCSSVCQSDAKSIITFLFIHLDESRSEWEKELMNNCLTTSEDKIDGRAKRKVEVISGKDFNFIIHKLFGV